MGKIATEQEAANIGGITSSCLKGVTKSKALEYGCKVYGSYQNNQCVQLSDLAKQKTICTVRAVPNGRQVRIDCEFAVASELTVSCIVNDNQDVDVVVKKGNFTAVKAIGITVSRVMIISLNPIEDSTYIYRTIIT